MKEENYKIRCADCSVLVEKNSKWFCDECGKFCKDVNICPEGLKYSTIKKGNK